MTRNVVGTAGYYGFEVVGDGNSLTGNAPGNFDPGYGDYDLNGVDNVVN